METHIPAAIATLTFACGLAHCAEFYYDLDFKSNRLRNVAGAVGPLDAANEDYVGMQPGLPGPTGPAGPTGADGALGPTGPALKARTAPRAC